MECEKAGDVEEQSGCASYGSEGQSDDPLNLDTIPIEVLLQIFQFVDATDLLRRVSLVSKYFHEILSNEMTWKIKQEKRWGGTRATLYPPVDLLDDKIPTPESTPPPDSPPPSPTTTYYARSFTRSTFPWSRSCVKREEQIKLWSDPCNMVHREISSHIGCIDSIHLFTRSDSMLLASGSRDRSISVWNVNQLLSTDQQSDSSTSPRITAMTRAHNGWIWDFAVNNEHLVSCSWDTTAKAWDLNTLQCVSEFRSSSALLSVSSTSSLVAIGAFNRRITLLDPRQISATPIHTYTSHARSVLSVGLDSNYVISCGEDGRTVKHDLRTRKTLSSFKLKGEKTYPTTHSFRETQITFPYFYVGDNTGSIHLVDLLTFKPKRTYKSHDSQVRGVFHNLGSVLTCSRDGKLSISDPSLALRSIGQVDVGPKIELPCVHSVNNVVACGGGDGVIRVWGQPNAL